MHINLYAEASQLSNSMMTLPQRAHPRLRQLACTSIEEEFHESSTLAELRRLFLRESAAQDVLVDLAGDYLDEVVKSNDQCLVQTTRTVHRNLIEFSDSDPCQTETESKGIPGSMPCTFHGRRAGFTPSFLLDRISKYSRGSPCCCVAALIYLERFQQRCPAVKLTSTSFQRLLLVASMTANKYLEDHALCHNKSW